LDTVIKSVHYTTSEKFGLDTVIKYVHYTPSGKNELDTIIYMGKNSVAYIVLFSLQYLENNKAHTQISL
jgi:hypothetical protein